MLPISPAPADEENPPGSSDEESESETDQVVNEEAVLDMDDDIADDETLLPFEVPDGYSLVSSAPAALTQNLVNQDTASAGDGLVQGGHHTKGPSTHKPSLRL